jgi:hypothetical protein
MCTLCVPSMANIPITIELSEDAKRLLDNLVGYGSSPEQEATKLLEKAIFKKCLVTQWDETRVNFAGNAKTLSIPVSRALYEALGDVGSIFRLSRESYILKVIQERLDKAYQGYLHDA